MGAASRLLFFIIVLSAVFAALIGISPADSPAAEGSFVQDILSAHNRYRDELKLPPLTWSADLAAHAGQWADRLASDGRMYHSSGTGEGENLWMGTSGYYSYTKMVDSWGDEKKYFKPGRFPHISTSGSWQDAGHYTQIIWRNTKQVGCALSKSGGMDILVCRYSPPGNYMGQTVY